MRRAKRKEKASTIEEPRAIEEPKAEEQPPETAIEEQPPEQPKEDPPPPPPPEEPRANRYLLAKCDSISTLSGVMSAEEIEANGGVGPDQFPGGQATVDDWVKKGYLITV